MSLDRTSLNYRDFWVWFLCPFGEDPLPAFLLNVNYKPGLVNDNTLPRPLPALGLVSSRVVALQDGQVHLCWAQEN